MNTIIGTKLAMDQTWDKNGHRIPVTVVVATPMVITQVKSEKSDGYNAVQVGIGTKSAKNINKPQINHLKKKAKDKVPAILQEIRLTDVSQLKIGDTISPTEVLEEGDVVAVSGTSKGRGFSGVIKRWGFHGGPRTHGQSDRERAPGSIGQGTDPGRVHKGKKMPGRYGNQRFTIKNLRVINIDEQHQTVWLSGPIPGTKGSLITITKTNQKDFPGLFYEKPEDQEKSDTDNNKSQEDASPIQKESPKTTNSEKKQAKDAPVRETKEEPKIADKKSKSPNKSDNQTKTDKDTKSKPSPDKKK